MRHSFCGATVADSRKCGDDGPAAISEKRGGKAERFVARPNVTKCEFAGSKYDVLWWCLEGGEFMC
jgi:hypothetical protein